MVDTYDTLDELWLGAAAQLREEGTAVPSRDGESKEILGFTGRLSDPRANFMFNPERKASPAYAAAELLWYLSGYDAIDMVAAYAPSYKRFAQPPRFKYAFGAYGGRLNHHDFKMAMIPLASLDGLVEVTGSQWYGLTPRTICNQLHAVIWLLSKKPNTRQAVVSMWTPADLVHAISGDKNDLPCSLNLIFMVRDGKLYLQVNMRSNDIWLGLPYDAWAFTSIQRLVAEALGLELGWYQHSAMSLHVYDRNYDKFLQAASPESFSTGILEYWPHKSMVGDSIWRCTDLERHNRTVGTYANECDDYIGKNSMLGQVLLMAATKWNQNLVDQIHNNVMRRYTEAFYDRSSATGSG